MINNLIAVLGWEERFYEGVLRNFDRFSCQVLYLIIFKEYEPYSLENLKKIEKKCSEKKIKLYKMEFIYQKSANNWRNLESLVDDNLINTNNILLDISTMPRETVWGLLFFLRRRSINIHYIYYMPLNYGDWLCKEPDKPRLLYKHSGIAEFGFPTALMILTGFDYDRTSQLVRFYEPALTVLGLQKGYQFDNHNRNIKESHEAECKGCEMENFEIDFYSGDFGLSVLNQEISKLKDKYNIIVASLGPKISSISLYRIFIEHPEIALTYVPTKEYNTSYSTGISDEPIYGKFSDYLL